MYVFNSKCVALILVWTALSACSGGGANSSTPSTTPGASQAAASTAAGSVGTTAVGTMATGTMAAGGSSTGPTSSGGLDSGSTDPMTMAGIVTPVANLSVALAVPKVTTPANRFDSARFLIAATFGPNASEIEHVSADGYDGWLDQQFAMNQAMSHTASYDQQYAANGNQLSQDWLYFSFWKNAIAGQDQLGQRVAFALSQIFVVSLVDNSVGHMPRGAANYLDTLRNNAFGNFRTLLEAVTRHPMMGVYQSFLANQGESGRLPDESFAREVMQLFTIGPYELNSDGSMKTSGNSVPIDAYSDDDVTGLAKVFTGWSWNGPSSTNDYFFGTIEAPDREITPMRAYENYHSSGAKVFLGRNCPGGTPAADSLRCALDILFDHPNVGPFFGRQLIQRLVTSNPSGAYIARVAAAFADNGQGVRGDMKAVIRAVLLDPEARTAPSPDDERAGKVREPVLRLTALLRAFDSTSGSGLFRIGATDDQAQFLGQTILRAPSVFNFYRPGYTPPNSGLANVGLVSPESQLTNELSVAGYLNTMRIAVPLGYGGRSSGGGTDVQQDYADELSIAGDSAALLDRINLLLTAGQMTASTRQVIKQVVDDITMPADPQYELFWRKCRVFAGVFLTVASPEFIVQR
jgi:uncharacterized protein (DUF1800 family)